MRKYSNYFFVFFILLALINCDSSSGTNEIKEAFTVTYNSNGATRGMVPIDTKKYEPGQSVIVAGNTGSLTKYDYSFAGWNTKIDDTGITYTQGETFLMGDSNLLLYARWTKKPVFTVIYNSNEAISGTVPIDLTKYEPGMKVTVLSNSGNLLKTNHSFNCWNTETDGRGIDRAERSTFFMENNNIVLYAKWTANYTIFYNKNDSQATGTMQAQTIDSGTTAKLTTNSFVKQGWSFSGWSLTEEGEVIYPDTGNFTMGNSDVTLYAKWTPNNYIIVFDKNDAGATGTMSNQTIACGTTQNLFENLFTKTGWTFLGWAITPVGDVVYLDKESFLMGIENIVLYAKWEPPEIYSLRDIGPAGGFIFYDKGSYSDGWRYLEAATKDWTIIQWGSSGTLIGGTWQGIGTGEANTIKIVTWLNNNGEVGRAAQLCDGKTTNGYTDWFLPSREELNQIYLNLWTFGLGSLSGSYWSSSESNLYYVWIQNFTTGSQVEEIKAGYLNVRAIRTF
jgi:uncharacterized repeat protein (TIGR02543 family)